MFHDFSQFPGLCLQDFRDPKEDRGFIYGVAIADISLSRQEGGGYRGKGGRSEGLRAEWNDRVLYKYRCSVGASGYATVLENHQGRTTLSTTWPRVSSTLARYISPSFSSLSSFFPLLLFPSSPFIEPMFFRPFVHIWWHNPRYFFSWQLKWISISLGSVVSPVS